MTIIEVLENALETLEAEGYMQGDLHDDLAEAIAQLRYRHKDVARSQMTPFKELHTGQEVKAGMRLYVIQPGGGMELIPQTEEQKEEPRFKSAEQVYLATVVRLDGKLCTMQMFPEPRGHHFTPMQGDW